MCRGLPERWAVNMSTIRNDIRQNVACVNYLPRFFNKQASTAVNECCKANYAYVSTHEEKVLDTSWSLLVEFKL